MTWSLIKDADLQGVVGITVVDTYINHLLPDNNISDIDIARYKVIIGDVLVNQQQLNVCKLQLAQSGFNQELNDRVNELREHITVQLNSLPPLEVLENCSISCERDTFLEILIMCIKNSSLSHQHSFFKIKNAKKNFLEKKINMLKLDFNANAGEILRNER